MRVAIYCRVSTNDQDCTRQEFDLLAFANRLNGEIIGVWKETASGAKNDRAMRKEIMALAQAREIDAVLVTELTRWGRSTTDLLDTLHQLAAFGVSVIAQTGFQFDLSTPQGKLIASLMASLAEFERDVIRERVRSGLAAAKARGKKIGRRPGRSNRVARLEGKVLELVAAGNSYRAIASQLNLSKVTVNEIVKAHRQSLAV